VRCGGGGALAGTRGVAAAGVALGRKMICGGRGSRNRNADEPMRCLSTRPAPTVIDVEIEEVFVFSA